MPESLIGLFSLNPRPPMLTFFGRDDDSDEVDGDHDDKHQLMSCL